MRVNSQEIIRNDHENINENVNNEDSLEKDYKGSDDDHDDHDDDVELLFFFFF